MAYKTFLGYRKGDNGLPEIVPEQAELVRRIYDLFVSGMTTCLIANILIKEGIPTSGGKTKWRASTIESILTNEKYKGDALLQKKYTTDFLQKKMKVNGGEVPQYYVEGSHPAIIAPEMFDRVQIEFTRRRKIGRKYSGKSIFSCRIVCGDCGEYFGSKVWNKGDKYERTVWQCNAKFTNEVKCTTPHVSEDRIKEGFLEAFNQLLPDRGRLLEDCRMMQESLADTSELDSKIEKINEEMEVVTELIRKCIEENSSKIQNQEEYMRKYSGLVDRHDMLKGKRNDLTVKRTERIAKADEIGGYMFRLYERDCALDHFDDRLWIDTIDQVTVFHDGRMLYRFQDGTESKI